MQPVPSVLSLVPQATSTILQHWRSLENENAAYMDYSLHLRIEIAIYVITRLGKPVPMKAKLKRSYGRCDEVCDLSIFGIYERRSQFGGTDRGPDPIGQPWKSIVIM
jgi:hypothetical protein